MKYLLAIFLSVSLYTPDIAKLTAYVDYVVDFASSDKINLCDCKAVLEQSSQPEDHPHIVQTDTEWKYIITPAFVVPVIQMELRKQAVANLDNRLCKIPFDIFKPPRV